MRVAVLSQPLGANYGGIMQAWALQRALRQLGHDPIVVDRHFPVRSGSALRRLGKLKRMVNDARLGVRGNACYWKHAEALQRPQQEFIRRNIARSGPLRSDSALREYFRTGRFDAVVVGSDQVWRPRYSPSLDAYFLGFLDGQVNVPKRIAYAASFGVGDWEFTEEQTLACRSLVQEFHAVSVREKSGAHLCAEHLNVTAEWVADPTLLHSRQDYISEFCGSTRSGGGGLFTYILDHGPEKFQLVGDLESALGIGRFSRQPKPPENVVRRADLALYSAPPADAWIRGFHESDFVVTDSFHGTLFSIIFRKPFVAIANPDRGAERFGSILGLLGLRDRLVVPGQDYDLADLASPVDYSMAVTRLEAFRKASWNYLLRNLGDER